MALMWVRLPPLLHNNNRAVRNCPVFIAKDKYEYYYCFIGW